MEYKIIRGTSIADLADAVNENIGKGWQPHGGICFAQPGVMDIMVAVPHPWAQAMTRDADDEPI